MLTRADVGVREPLLALRRVLASLVAQGDSAAAGAAWMRLAKEYQVARTFDAADSALIAAACVRQPPSWPALIR
jgi:hypothetical protein